MKKKHKRDNKMSAAGAFYKKMHTESCFECKHIFNNNRGNRISAADAVYKMKL